MDYGTRVAVGVGVATALGYAGVAAFGAWALRTRGWYQEGDARRAPAVSSVVLAGVAAALLAGVLVGIALVVALSRVLG